MRTRSKRGRRRRGKPFCKGFDPRRHLLTQAERRKGGLSCAKKFTCHGKWFANWWDRCRDKVKNSEGEYVDVHQEERPSDDEIPW